MRAGLAMLALAMLASPLSARDSLGVFDGWGAFRDADVPRCYAIAEPQRRGGGSWRAFASVGYWPRNGIRGQVHFRLSREVRGGTPVTLTAGERRFALVAGGADAWAPDRRADAAIVAAMRSARAMRVTATGAQGAFADGYALRGAATAIDAAALGCARLR